MQNKENGKEKQGKKLYNVRLRITGINSDLCQGPDKVIFNFSSYNVNDHEKTVFCKDFSFAIPPKAIGYLEFLRSYEMLFREITSLDIIDFNKACIKSRLRDSAYSPFKQVFKISDKNLSREQVKATVNLVKNKDKGSNTVIHNRNDHISKPSKILEGTSKIRRVSIEERKTLNYLIQMENKLYVS